VAQGGLAKAEQTTVEYGDGVLRIEASAENQILGSSGSIEVTVQLPGGSRIEAKAAAPNSGRRTVRQRHLRGLARLDQARRGRERPPHHPRR
jgi:hypothetical protein